MNDKVVVNEIVLLAVVVERKRKDALIGALSKAGGQLINTIYGKGLVKAGYLREALGLVPEDNRVLVTCLLPSEESGPVIEALTGEFDLDKPNAGIAFTIPVETLSF
ncbi:MAG: hypothetical protein LBI59_03045 [Candidatus Accumulibacter sp.]|jgi:hypothetical protein|nr:hypothetical protein [Accumulibacter sp.]